MRKSSLITKRKEKLRQEKWKKLVLTDYTACKIAKCQLPTNGGQRWNQSIVKMSITKFQPDCAGDKGPKLGKTGGTVLTNNYRQTTQPSRGKY